MQEKPLEALLCLWREAWLLMHGFLIKAGQILTLINEDTRWQQPAKISMSLTTSTTLTKTRKRTRTEATKSRNHMTPSHLKFRLTKYSGVHSTGFKDLLLKPQLQRAIQDCGFEHPSEVQQECIPHAMIGVDVLCQAKSGMGKTAVFVLTILH